MNALSWWKLGSIEDLPFMIENGWWSFSVDRCISEMTRWLVSLALLLEGGLKVVPSMGVGVYEGKLLARVPWARYQQMG